MIMYRISGGAIGPAAYVWFCHCETVTDVTVVAIRVPGSM